ncbi:hypothetical protein J4E82_009199 [Alternaria postmessia]|uniref:uncharacterized protein n=1 Tax=Alternaria postmessia TaxID=1187938 RepID=UPI00222483F1|nr:uncharacterized protein J4E82_009199 [Alternaria postmessia]KAI5372142.1 hypothetical protein J4E82_009199 [Alternaria postmessia]
MSSKDNLALDLEHGVRRWDRARWISVFSSHNPTIREVTECLGLGLSASSSTTNRGIPKFDNPDYRKLSSEVTKLSKELPKERDALLDFAADPSSLNQELEELLASYGPAIWGRDADRSCLLTPDPTKKTYNKDLFYEEPEHKDILKIHLHRWIIIKACYYIRNMKLKRPSGANEYDQLADIDGEGLSLTPPDPETVATTEFEVKPINLKKRKSNAHLTMSDDDELEASPVKRPYSTMPVSRKGSPRKSLKSLYPAGPGSTENIPPMPTHSLLHRFSPAPGTASEPARLQLSPLSNNDLNGVSRPSAVTQNSTSSAPGGFTAYGNKQENLRGKCIELLIQLGIVTATAIQAHMSHPHIVRQWLDLLQTHLALHRQLLLHRLQIKDSQQSLLPFNLFNMRILLHNHNSNRNRRNRNSSHRKHSHKDHNRHRLILHISITRRHMGNHLNRIILSMRISLLIRIFRLNISLYLDHQVGLIPQAILSAVLLHLIPAVDLAAPNQPATAPNKQVTSAPAIQSAPAYGIQLVPTQEAPPAPSSRQRLPSNPSQPAAPQHASPHQSHQPVLKSQQPQPPPEMAHAVQPPQTFPRGSVSTSTADLRLLQCEVTAGLFTFFYPRTTMPPDEPALLVRMHTLWFHGESLFRAELPQHFDLVSKILTAWLHERQAIASLRHSMQANPGVSHVGLVDRLLAMNDLRAMRLKWKNMSSIDGLSPEDLLCMAFRVMTNTEGSEYLFKDGLARLELGVFEFLRSEDSKIVMQRRDTRAG